MRTGQQTDIIDLIHDTPFNPALWSDVIDQLIDTVGAGSAVMTTLDIVSGVGTGMPVRQNPAVMDDYLAHWSSRNPLHIVEDPITYMRGWRPIIVRDGDWIERDALRATPYFNEFLRPLGADEHIFVRLGLEDTKLSAISFARPEHRGGFDNKEIAAVGRYHRHMVQAVRTARRVKASQEALDHLDALLASTDQALLFLDGQGRVRHMSAAAERQLFDTGLLRLVDGRLEAPTAGDNGQLLQLVQAAIADVPAGRESLTLAKPGGGRRVALTVVPLGARSLAALSSERFVMLSAVEAPASVAAPTRDLDIRMRFGFTGAEARVALAIADGDSLRDFADRAGVSIHTVRAQLGAIFAKTGTRRQADLVRLLLESTEVCAA